MVLTSRQRRQRRGIILLVVLALITLFASIGVAFVYFSEQEVTKAADQKAGETIKLPDADLMFNFVMRQIIFPTNNSASALFTQSLLENMYGRSVLGVSSIAAYNGTGWRSNVDPSVVPGGQDNLFRRNMQGRQYNELIHGSLNPPYTYPDHKNPYLGAVAANWTTRNYPLANPATYTQHGPVAIARSFAREMKFRIAYTVTATGATGIEEVRLNPYSNEVFPSGIRHADYWRLNPGGNLTMLMGDLPNFPAPGTRIYTPNATITCNPNGTAATLNLLQPDDRAHSLRPTPRSNPNFPPPGDLGGDVKNLPPEVKTLVGYDGNNNPVFANNDSYWMDIGFPAIPYSNNRKIKPLAAIFIMDNDGKVNLNHAGNLRGQVAAGTFHASTHGLGPWEINPTKMGMPLAELQRLKAGATVGTSVVRGSHGFASDQDPSMQGVAGMYTPLVRGAPFYAPYNLDGTTDGYGPPGQLYAASGPWQLRSDGVIPATDPTYRRFPFFFNPVPGAGPTYGPNGFSNGSFEEVVRGGVAKSPLFAPPFAPNQVGSNLPSMGATSAFRSFAASNQEALYRARDVGADKIDSDLRKLIPNTLSNASLRWQLTTVSSDLNVPGIAPGWYLPLPGQEIVRPDLSLQPRPSLPQREPGALPITGNYQFPLLPAPTNQRVGGYGQPVAGSIDNSHPLSPNALTYPMSPYPAYLAHGVNGEYQMQIPVAAAPPAPVATPLMQNFWRSIFGNSNRIDLARQLPDYPLPIDNNSHLNIADPLVRARYKIALQARQRFALELYHAMENLMHPGDLDAKRYIAQLAVNMVDYIDNDDYPTWMPIPSNPPLLPLDSTNVVWGTELPRLVINEVYSEVVNSDGDSSVTANNRAGEDYDIRNWVELYNPLETSTYNNVWPDGANARLNVNNVSVYRLLVTRRDNMTNIRQNPANTMGYPNSTALSSSTLKVVYFPAGATVAPSDQNYGNGTSTGNPGFYLVGSTQPPRDTTPGAVAPPAPLNFPIPDLPTNEMTLEEAISRNSPITNAIPNRCPSIVLQRLANPYLPHVGMGDPATTTATDPTDPTAVFYNPYITVDYVTNHKLNKAVQYDANGNPDDSNPDPDNNNIPAPGPQFRVSLGKMQPYAGLNDYTVTGTAISNNSVWTEQSPDRDAAVAGLQRLQNQPQHTFLRHNAVETDRRSDMGAMVVPNPTIDANGLASSNTLRVPFDWLVHLDRTPTSPVDLLHVSGYRPHELTQQFNQVLPIGAVELQTPGTGVVAPNYNLNTIGSTIRIASTTTPFIGTWFGVPYKAKVGDLYTATFAMDATGATTRKVLVRVVGVDTTNYQWIEVVTGNIGTVHNSTPTNANEIRIVVPFAHYAPWYRAQQLVASNGSFPFSQSSGELYRLLEAVAVRNPGIDVGQIRFTSTTANNVIAGPVGTVWIQLDSGTNIMTGQQIPSVRNSRLITTNEALMLVKNGDSVANPDNVFNNTTQVGDTMVISDAFGTRRTTVLEIDSNLNRIRVMDPALTVGTVPNLVVDYAYLAGRQLGKVNVNTMWDIETWKALADVQPSNWFTSPTIGYPEQNVDRVFRRIYQQRQPGYFYTPRMVGSTGLNGVGEDRPFQGMAAADISGPAPFIPVQGIGNTFLSDRYQESLNGYAGVAPRANDMAAPVPGIAPNIPLGFPGDTGDNTPDRFLRTLFEVGNPGEHHPFRRFELLNKVWNNVTVRSNTFSVWVTIGFFEYDDQNGLGAEVGQIQGKNTRYRFFSVVDRTTVDAWLKSWNLHNPMDAQSSPPIASNVLPANINMFMNADLFPSLDPRQDTYPVLNGTSNSMAVCSNAIQVQPSIWRMDPSVPNPFVDNIVSPQFDLNNHNNLWRLVQVESDAGVEIGQVVPNPLGPPTGQLFIRLSIPPTGQFVIVRPLPVPRTILHWSQFK